MSELIKLLKEQEEALERDIAREMHQGAVLGRIANQILNIPTLVPRNRDSLDFHEVSVGAIREALKAAYEQGRKDPFDAI